MNNLNTLHQLLIEKHTTVAVAESCTGGLLGAALTTLSGSSAYFLGGIQSYSNKAKETLLGVNPDDLEKFGAVSGEVAKQMAQGALARLGADVALSVTGIAGPNGGTDEKPVGLTWIGIADKDGVQASQFIWEGDREENRRLSVEAALDMLLDWLQNQAAD